MVIDPMISVEYCHTSTDLAKRASRRDKYQISTTGLSFEWIGGLPGGLCQQISVLQGTRGDPAANLQGRTPAGSGRSG